MQSSNRFRWTVILLAVPLAHCARGEPPGDEDEPGAGRPSGGRTGGSGGASTSGGNSTSGGSSAGKSSFGGNPIFGGGGGTAGATSAGGKSTGGAAGDSTGGTNASGRGGTAGSSSTSGAGGGSAGKSTMPEHCTDGMANEDETDEDCGGSCKACMVGQSCMVPGDCVGRNCAEGTCGEPTHCVNGWDSETETCGAMCRNATQSDQAACADVLTCYIENDCGPADCGGQLAKCGGNTLGLGSAAYTIADTVYECMCE